MKLEEEIKSKAIRDDRLKAYLEILFTASFLNNKHSKILKPFRISPQQYNILRILRGSYPGSLNIHSIKTRMLEKTPNTTRMIDKLHANGYIQRERGQNDRRQVLVKISDKGLHIMTEIDRKNPEFLKFMYNLTDSEAAGMCELLEKLRS